MNIIDIIILLFIALCTITGLKRGVIKETINVVGNFLILILSFLLMGKIASLLYSFVPFLNLQILGISLSALNILVYQLIAFALTYLILSFLFRIILGITKIIDRIIKSLIIFQGLSSVLGAIVGAISGYITSFVVLLILSVPFSSNETFHQSKINHFILRNTPILTNLTSGIYNATNDIYTLTEMISNDQDKTKNSNEYNLQILNIMLKYKIVSIDTVEKLVSQNKLSDLKNIDNILNQYQEG